jgi:hypothetical protein
MAFFRQLGAPTQENLLIGAIIYFEMNSCFEEFFTNLPFLQVFDAFSILYKVKSIVEMPALEFSPIFIRSHEGRLLTVEGIRRDTEEGV